MVEDTYVLNVDACVTESSNWSTLFKGLSSWEIAYKVFVKMLDHTTHSRNFSQALLYVPVSQSLCHFIVQATLTAS